MADDADIPVPLLTGSVNVREIYIDLSDLDLSAAHWADDDLARAVPHVYKDPLPRPIHGIGRHRTEQLTERPWSAAVASKAWKELPPRRSEDV